MINYIWVLMIVSGVIAAIAQGRVDIVTLAILNGAKEAVAVCFSLISIMVFWLGIMKVAEDGGLLKKFSKLTRPLIKFLFPSVPANNPAIGYIVSNLTANFFGLGNAATPMGIKAMEELQKINPNPNTATPAMCTLLALNTSGITLVPTMIIGLRLKYGSENPTDIISTTLIATLIATSCAVLLDRYYRKKHYRITK